MSASVSRSHSARTLQELVSAAASLHPDRVAVTYCGVPVSRSSMSGVSVSLSYRELMDLADELSGALRDSCSNPGVIGLYCSDDLLTPVWILGILQVEAAYVPLDPGAPGRLLAGVMKQCSLRYCAVNTELLQLFQKSVMEQLHVEVYVELPRFRLTLFHIEQTEAGVCGPVGVPHRELAYVLHTSGTTGPPKTVRVPHRCILPNILHLRSLFQMSAEDVVFLTSPLTFDPSVVDIFLALSSGARLLIVPLVIKKTPNRLVQLLRDYQTTVLQATPTLLLSLGRRAVEREVLSPGSSLRVLALGGETCPSPSLLRSWRHKDNKTHIYNIYGVTEVSCWASCFRLPESLLQSGGLVECPVPLGTPLMDTVMEVRDDCGCVVTDGEGQVFIGGEDRVCLLDGEDVVVPGTMRATGDWVKVEDGQMYYLGRRDRVIKRHGKQVNLDGLQQLLLTLPQVDGCAVSLHRGRRLLAFVVASASGDVRATLSSVETDGEVSGTLSSVETDGDQRATLSSVETDGDQRATLSSVETDGEVSGTLSSVEMDGDQRATLSSVETDVRRLILEQLSELLPPHSVPDSVLLVPVLPRTPHGKVDMKALMTSYERQWRSSPGAAGDLKPALLSLWKDSLGLPGHAAVDEESNFLFSGGDSLKALRLCEDVLATVGVTSPELLEIVLEGTFSDVLRHVAGVAQSSLPQDVQSSVSGKRPAEPPSVGPVKRGRRDYAAAERWRTEDGGEGAESADLTEEDARRDVGVGLRLSWSSDTGRCVDASPVLLVRHSRGQRSEVSVFIGSHSHRIQALDLLTGSLLWERVLGDRIEASAAVSRCGSLVIVGCYDGCVYFLCAESGVTQWTFETDSAVKTRPAVDPVTGAVVVGSHDGHVYALNPQVERCVWRRHCGGGAVFSSPRLHPVRRQLYVASLGGRLLCLHADSGDVLWSYRRDVPFFSSPDVSGGVVVIGSVDGNICCLNDSGGLLWQFPTEAPVFSSPSFTPDQQRVLCGSHDGRLYCLNCADGSSVWTFQTPGKVYATPCVFDGSGVGRRGSLVGVASTDGSVWILDGRDGRMLTSHTLPGELFSSPAVWGRRLVIGCRNDRVYCLDLTVEQSGSR